MKTALWFQGYHHEYPGDVVVWILRPDALEIENLIFENHPRVLHEIREWLDKQSFYFIQAKKYKQLQDTLNQRIETRNSFRRAQERKQRREVREDLELMRRSRSGMLRYREEDYS